MSAVTLTNGSLSQRYLQDVWDGVVEMFPLLCVEVLQLRGVLVLTLVSRVRPGVELVLGLNRTAASEQPQMRKAQAQWCFHPLSTVNESKSASKVTELK